MTDNPADRVVLRRLEAADIPTIASFECEIATISFPDDPVTDLAFYERKLRQAIEDRKSEPLVGVLDGRIVAWAWIGIRENFITHERYGEVRSFYVVEDFRATGYALKLMRACVDWAAAHGLTRLTGRTHSANESMQGLYQMFGFEPKHITYERAVTPTGSAEPRRPRPPRDADRPYRRRKGKR